MVPSLTKPLAVLTEAPLPAEVRGGIEEYAYSVVAALRDEGHRVTVLTTTFPTNDRAAPPAGTVTLPARMMLARPLVADPRAYWRTFSLIRRHDVVHLHMPFPFVEVFSAFAAKIVGTPFIATYQMDAILDDPMPGHRHRRLSRLIEWAYVRMSAYPTLRLATRFVTSTSAYRRESPVLSRVPGDSVTVHQGIDRSKFQSLDVARARAIREGYLQGGAHKLVVFVGRFVPYKGLEYLIEAAEELQGTDIRFVLGGRGPLHDHIRALIEQKKLTNVQLVGFVPDDDLMNLFYAADVVVSPSISLLECTPITLLEASALGTPVLGSTVGGTAETIPSDGVRGLLVPPRDVPALVEGLKRLLRGSGERLPPLPPRFWSDVAAEYSALMVATVARANGPDHG